MNTRVRQFELMIRAHPAYRRVEIGESLMVTTHVLLNKTYAGRIGLPGEAESNGNLSYKNKIIRYCDKPFT